MRRLPDLRRPLADQGERSRRTRTRRFPQSAGRPARRRARRNAASESCVRAATSAARCAAGGSSLQHEPGVTRTIPSRRRSACRRSRPTRPTSGSRRRSRRRGQRPHSEVCVAALGENCPAGSRTQIRHLGRGHHVHVPRRGRRAAERLQDHAGLPQRRHRWSDGDCAANNDCVVSIDLVNDKGTKIWMIVVTTGRTGPSTGEVEPHASPGRRRGPRGAGSRCRGSRRRPFSPRERARPRRPRAPPRSGPRATSTSPRSTYASLRKTGASVGSRIASASRTRPSASTSAPVRARMRPRTERHSACVAMSPSLASSRLRSHISSASSSGPPFEDRPARVAPRSSTGCTSRPSLERDVRPSKLLLRGIDLPREHLRAPRLDPDPSGVQLESELLEERPRPGDEVPRLVERPLHCVEAAQDREQVPLGLPIPRCRLDPRLAARDRLVDVRRPERGRSSVRGDRPPLLPDVACPPRVLDRAAPPPSTAVTEPARGAGRPARAAGRPSPGPPRPRRARRSAPPPRSPPRRVRAATRRNRPCED